MPTAVALAAENADRVSAHQTAMRVSGRKTGRSTMAAARTFSVKLERAGGWEQMSRARQLDAIAKARSFASWMMVTGQLTIDADVLGRVYLRLGTSARAFCPDAHAWFLHACGRIDVRAGDIALQWNAFAMITAVTGVPPEEVDDHRFALGSAAIIDAYVARGKPESGRNMASIFHRIRLTLFHAGRLDSHRRPARHAPVSVTGWAVVAPGIAENARRYIAQVELSLRPSTVKHIESDLREFGTWLASAHPQVVSCADLERRHIEDYKTWVSAKHGRYTGKPLSRVSIKNRLINLHCFFDRITECGYPDPPQRPLIFAGDLPILDKPLPRFLDDAAATKLMRASRADPDPLSRLIVELLARTGIRKSELIALTVDAVVLIGSAFWLRIPVGKLHNDRYIPLHPQLKELLDDWITHHRPDRSALEPVAARTQPAHHLAPGLHGAGPGQPAGRDRSRHRSPTQTHPGHPGHQPWHEPGYHRRAARPQDPRDDDGLRPHRRQDRRRGVLRRHREGRSPLRPAPPTHQLPSDDEGTEMRKLRGEMHRRMLGNGYCARPVEMGCHFESICESCTFFVTTIEFRPTLQAQRDDAAEKGQVGRIKIFDGLIERLDHDAS